MAVVSIYSVCCAMQDQTLARIGNSNDRVDQVLRQATEVLFRRWTC